MPTYYASQVGKNVHKLIDIERKNKAFNVYSADGFFK